MRFFIILLISLLISAYASAQSQMDVIVPYGDTLILDYDSFYAHELHPNLNGSLYNDGFVRVTDTSYSVFRNIYNTGTIIVDTCSYLPVYDTFFNYGKAIHACYLDTIQPFCPGTSGNGIVPVTHIGNPIGCLPFTIRSIRIIDSNDIGYTFIRYGAILFKIYDNGTKEIILEH